MQEVTYHDEILFSDFVEHHLTDVVFVKQGEQTHFWPLIISADQ